MKWKAKVKFAIGRRLAVDVEVKAASFHEAVEKIKEEYGENIEIVGIEKKEEDRITILGKLLNLLACTRAGEDLLDLQLEETSQGEFVYAVFENRQRERINVTADSGAMMIIDIIKALM